MTKLERAQFQLDEFNRTHVCKNPLACNCGLILIKLWQDRGDALIEDKETELPLTEMTDYEHEVLMCHRWIDPKIDGSMFHLLTGRKIVSEKSKIVESVA